MRIKRFAYCLGVLAVALAASLLGRTAAIGAGPSDGAAFFRGVEAYKEGRYAEAAALWKGIAEGGVVNARLYYNLGNAFLKEGELGRAVLWYERAKKLAPGDPDLSFNLDRALERTRDAREEDGAALGRIIFFLDNVLSHGTVQTLALAANLLFWAALAGYAATGRRPLKIVCLTAAAACLLLLPTALHGLYADAFETHGIVLPESAAARAGASPKATRLFTLHAGSRVRVDEERDGHVRVRYGADKLGWMRGDAVGRLSATSGGE